MKEKNTYWANKLHLPHTQKYEHKKSTGAYRGAW